MQPNINQLLDFIDSSPSPWHAVATMQAHLTQQGFIPLAETDTWQLVAGGRYVVVRDDSSMLAFIAGSGHVAEQGFKIIGAHTDSPGLRLKPQPAEWNKPHLRLGVEIYGGPILATFSDRDLSLAGRIAYQTSSGTLAGQLISFAKPLLRLPNLAIHLNRTVNEEGLKLHKHNELPLILACAQEQLPENYIYQLLSQEASIAPEQLLSFELAVFDTQKGSLWGAQQAFYADSQVDNLTSCHAGLNALLNAPQRPEATLVLACFDHEEVGSCSHKGAESSFLSDVLARIALNTDTARDTYQRALARSFMISVDMAHGYHPNFPQAYDKGHQVFLNHGPVIKYNANQRYASDSESGAKFIHYCKLAGVPYQVYSHRSDLACGSTIGPMTAAKLGLKTVDVGCAMWAMHSVRETAGVHDYMYMCQALSAFFNT